MPAATPGLILVAMAVGCLPPLQAGVNATLSSHHGHPLRGALTNTVVASLALTLTIVVLRIPGSDLHELANAPVWRCWSRPGKAQIRLPGAEVWFAADGASRFGVSS